MKKVVQLAGKIPLGILLSVLIGLFILFMYAWLNFISPNILSFKKDFTYTADIVSYDDFYDESNNEFKGPVLSNTTFSYKSDKQDGPADIISNTFDVRKPTGEKIFAVTRQYGIDAKTGQHIKGYGDRDRSGYLFAPRNLHKQDFDYWHVNYNTPAHMQFQSEETVLGVKTYRYQAVFTADQTQELTSLPGVGVSRGVELDVTLQLWIEPTTGHLVKYDDSTSAYYYDLSTKTRLNPWNKFTNRFSFSSIAAQARAAAQQRQQAQVVQIGVPIIVAALLTSLALIIGLTRRSMRQRTNQIAQVIAAVLAVASLGFWYSVGRTVELPESLEPMYPGASFGVIVLATILILQARQLLTRNKRIVALAMLSIISAISLFFALRGLLIGSDAYVYIPVTGGSEPLILPIAALGVGSFASALLAGLISDARWLSRVREMLVGIVTVLMLTSMLSYVYGESTPLLAWLHGIRLPAALALALVGVSIFSLEKDWLTTRQFKRLGKGAWLFMLVLFGMLTIIGVAWQTTKSNAIQQSQLQFQSDANTLQNALSDRLRIYTNVLYGAQGLFAASNSVDRDEWKAYTNRLRLAENYPGMQGIGFTQIIPKDQLAAHIAAIRKEGFQDYTVRPLNEPRDIYSSIVYLEPFDDRNKRAFGFDMLSEPTRRAALEKARNSGEAAMTNRVILLQETGTEVQYGFLVYIPVFKNGAPLQTESDRKAALLGYVYSPFRMKNFMQAITGSLANGIDIEVFDTDQVGDISKANQMFASSKTIDTGSIFQDTQTMVSSGHTWSVRYTGSNDYASGLNQELPTVVLIGGIILSAALAAAVFGLSSSQQRAVLYAKRATLALLKERNQAVRLRRKDEAMLGGISEGLIIFDKFGHIERVNSAAKLLLGYDEHELLDKEYSHVLKASLPDGSIIPAEKQPISMVLRGGKAIVNTELVYTRKDGSSFTAEIGIAPVAMGKRTIGAVEVFRDVTEERQLEKAKDEFLSLASHQLRTPLTAKRWNLELLLDGDVTEKLTSKQRDLVERINASNDRMIKLVNELLNVSRVESGRLQVNPEMTDIKELIRSVIDDTRPKLIENQQEVLLTVKEHLPKISVDPILIRQVFLNLLTNASKYSPAATTISVTCSIQQDHLIFAVQDQGYGVPKDQQAKLFTKFFRADNITAKDTDGNGLGLYLVKSIVDVSGGSIWFKSKIDKGSTFYVSLPITGSKHKNGEVSLS